MPPHKYADPIFDAVAFLLLLFSVLGGLALLAVLFGIELWRYI